MNTQPTANAIPYVRLLMRSRVQGLTNRIAQAATASPVQVASTLFVILIIWLGLYALFRSVFIYFESTPLEGAVAIPLVFDFFFVAMLLLLAVSNAIIAYTSLFRREEAAYLAAAPIPAKALVTVKYLETLLFSSWSLILLGIPLMIAIAEMTANVRSFYPLFIAMFLFFVPIPGAVGLLAAWMMARFLTRLTKRIVMIAGIIVLVGAGLWGIHSVQATEGDSAVWLKEFFSRIDFVQASLLPSAWVSTGIDHAIHDRPDEALKYLGVIVANGLFFSWVAINITARGFTRAYDHASGSRGRVGRIASSASGGISGLLFFYLPIRLKLIAVKDFRTFLRDPIQWSQLAILFGLMALYLLNMPQFHIDLISDQMSLMIPFLNLSAVSFILATFTSRFVFPLISLEGHQLWLIGLLPIRRSRILLAKFAFAMTVSASVAMATMGLSCIILKMSLAWTLIYLMVTFAVCIGLCGVSVGLGARLPNFAERNPTRIANGFGGTISLILSVGLIVFELFGMGMITWRARRVDIREVPDTTTILIASGVAATMILVSLVALWFGSRHLKKLEV